MYVSDWNVANLAKKLSGSESALLVKQTSPKSQIVTAKLRSLGMEFGGQPLLEQTVAKLVST